VVLKSPRNLNYIFYIGFFSITFLFNLTFRIVPNKKMQFSEAFIPFVPKSATTYNTKNCEHRQFRVKISDIFRFFLQYVILDTSDFHFFMILVVFRDLSNNKHIEGDHGLRVPRNIFNLSEMVFYLNSFLFEFEFLNVTLNKDIFLMNLSNDIHIERGRALLVPTLFSNI
jgi:hypothetical protein